MIDFVLEPVEAASSNQVCCRNSNGPSISAFTHMNRSPGLLERFDGS